MSKKYKVYIAHDFDDDSNYRYLFDAWNENNTIDFEIVNHTPGEINSYSIDYIKRRLNEKIASSDVTVVIIGINADKKHKDSILIGHKNWLNYEVAKSFENNNKLIAIELKRTNLWPEELYNKGATLATFSLESINKAINR